MRLRTVIITAALATVPPSVSHADPAPTERAGAGAPGNEADLRTLLEDIDRRAAQVADLQGRFRQEKYTSLLKKPLVSSGRVRMKDSVVRWDTEEPEPAVLFSDARELRMYYPRQSVVEVYPIDRRLAEMAASPLPRLASLREHFTLDRLPAGEKAGVATAPGELPLRLTPTDEWLKEHVDEVRVVLDVERACVVRVEVLDADGDRTLIRFDDLKLNAGVRDEDLALRLPAGTRVSRPLEGAGGPPPAGDKKDTGGKRQK